MSSRPKRASASEAEGPPSGKVKLGTPPDHAGVPRLRRFAPSLGIVLFATVATAQTTTDIIRGRVTIDTAALQGVSVRATSYYGGITKTATTDKNGRYTIMFVNGEGDYWLDFRKLGFAPKRFEIKRIGDEEILIADARMSSAIVALDEHRVIGERNRALPTRASNPDVGGGERPLTNGGVAPDQAGNLAAMAATVAGIQLIPGLDGAADLYSLLGLSGDQNNTTFNGLGSGINALPPDLLVTTSIVPFTFDPAAGGFSGAQIAIRTVPGSNFSRRAVTNANIAPQLEWADHTASAQGQEFTNMRFGGNGLGALVMDKAFYNGAYNVSRRFTDLKTLVNTNATGLAGAGVSPDSVGRLLNILDTQHVPARAAAAPGVQAQDALQGSLNVDLTPSASGTGNAFTLGVVGNYQRMEPVSRGSLLLATPAHAGETTLWNGSAALTHSNYFGFGVLSKTTFGIAESRTRAAPYERLPEGMVRVASALPDGSSSVKTLLFGGNSLLSASVTQSLQLANQLSWFSRGNRHTIKVTSSLTRDAFTSDLTPRLLGSYAFNSLADLEAGHPSAFNRTLARTRRSGSQLVGALSLGDYWRPTSALQVQYGVRVDGNHFLTEPAFNRSLLDAFGVRNDVVPNHVYASPRVGIQWYYGSSPKVSYAPGAARPPRAVVHAGIGVFQNMTTSQLLSPAASTTGLTSSTQTVSCVGSAVPGPDWSAFLADPSSIPTRCGDGATGSVFGTSSPNVVLFDPRFRQPRSLRGAVDWSSPVLDNRFVLGVQGIVSRGLAQGEWVDVNFDPTIQFTLGSEGGRPVFADPSTIVPTTGAIAAGGSRVSPAFQQVRMDRSGLGVDARQLTFNVKPVTADPRLTWDLTYTLRDVREQVSGFASTGGTPLERGWARSLLGGRHSVLLRWTDFPIFDVVYVTFGMQLASGPRYTPMIGGDMNGDGILNDRAFISDSVRSFGTSSARACLRRQVGRVAARASCQAPWTTNGGLIVKFNPQKIGLPKRVGVVLQLQNPFALADLVVHGGGDVRGWGQNIPPDENLLYVRGFDPVAQQFRYEVNHRFGSTRPQQATTHALPYVSLGVTLDVGLARERQLLTQRLNIGRERPGSKLPAESMKQLGTSSIPNPMAMILAQADSLNLTRKQADSLAFLSHLFATYADSMWTPVASHLAGLPESYRRGDAYDQYVTARERTVDYLLAIVPNVKGLLTSSQRRKLPPQIANYLDSRVLRFVRSSSTRD
jgi:hypothetical protein